MFTSIQGKKSQLNLSKIFSFYLNKKNYTYRTDCNNINLYHVVKFPAKEMFNKERILQRVMGDICIGSL